MARVGKIPFKQKRRDGEPAARAKLPVDPALLAAFLAASFCPSNALNSLSTTHHCLKVPRGDGTME